MKAAVLRKLSTPLVIENLEIPPLLPGQVCVKIAYSGVCHSQLMEVRGLRGEDLFLPHLLGHEGSGIVVSVGDDVVKVKPGQKVILGWIKGSGANVQGTKYLGDANIINAGGVTTFSQYSVVSENRCVVLPEGIPMDIAVLFGCAIPTGAGIVTNTLQPKPGSSIAIFGLGGIGLSALMATRLYNCSIVIGVDINEEKLNLAKEFGATHTINSTKVDPVQAIREITLGVGVDYSVEASGIASIIEQSFNSVRRGGGFCVFASHPKFGQKICIDPYELICGKRIQGSWGGESNPDRDIPLFADLYRKGKLPLEKLITKRYSLYQINDALDDLEQGRVGRPLIEIDSTIQ